MKLNVASASLVSNVRGAHTLKHICVFGEFILMKLIKINTFECAVAVFLYASSVAFRFGIQ